MRLLSLLALVACSGPISPPIGSHIGTRGGSYASSGGPYSSGVHVMRPPPNAPSDPLGTTRPGDRSCTEDRDCRPGQRCYPPDYTPPPPVTIAPAAAAPPAVPAPSASPAPVPSSPPPPAPAALPAPPSPAAPAPTASPAPPPPAGAPAPSSRATPAPTSPPVASPPAAPTPTPAPVAGMPSPVPPSPPAPAPTPVPAVCQTDPQCGNGLVCDDGRCSAPCTPTSCAPDRECRAGGHCMLIPCTDPRAGTCPQNSRCNPSNGVCERQVCNSGAQCDSGVCFRGRCYSHDAFCMP